MLLMTNREQSHSVAQKHSESWKKVRIGEENSKDLFCDDRIRNVIAQSLKDHLRERGGLRMLEISPRT